MLEFSRYEVSKQIHALLQVSTKNKLLLGLSPQKNLVFTVFSIFEEKFKQRLVHTWRNSNEKSFYEEHSR